MSEVEIKAKITGDSSQAVKSTNDYIDALKSAKKAVNEAKIGSLEHKKAQEDLAKATKDLATANDKSGGSFSKLKENLNSTVPGFQGASQGASGFGKQLWALVANPIVLILTAIVGACMLVYKAFTSTNDGADKMDQIMAGLGATIEVLRDRVLAVAGAIGKFFTGDFKGAMEQGKAAVSGIGQEIADEFAAAAQATKILQDLEDSMRAISVGRAELNRDLAKAKELMSDADASATVRRAAINKVRAAEGVQSQKELDQARANYNAIVAQNKLTAGVSDENLDREAAAKVALINLETQSAQNIRSFNKLEKSLNKEIQAKADQEAKERTDRNKTAADKAEKERQDSFKKIAADAKIVADEFAGIEAAGLTLLKEADAEKELLHQKEMDRGSFEMQLLDSNYKTKKKLSDEDLALRKTQQDEVQSILNNGMAIFSKQTIAGKGLAMAQALMNTYSGATDALRAKSTLPSPFDVVAKVANVAAVIATGFKSIRAIGAVQVPGGGGSSAPSMPSLTASAPLSPLQSSTVLNAGSIQGIGNAANGGVGRSFILESDITNNRERSERISRAARLG